MSTVRMPHAFHQRPAVPGPVGARRGPPHLDQQRHGAAGASGVFNYIKTVAGVTFNGAARKGSGAKNSDGSSSAAGQSAWDFALTGTGDIVGVDGLSWGAGYGVEEVDANGNTSADFDDNKHYTGFINYSMGPMTVGYQESHIAGGAVGANNETTQAWGIALAVNENLSVSYGEREVEYSNPSATDVTEDGEGIAVAYTMGSMKIAGNRNEVQNNAGTTGNDDSMTEIALSFAF